MNLNGEIKIAFLAFILALIGGCATIVSGTTQEVSFQSNPEGAKVTVSGRVIGKTPVTLQLKREKGQSLAFEKEGYEAHDVP